MAKLKITLKQHTPMIHFQPDQDGAIIRASEFKPKLDKFLIEKVFNNEFEVYKRYLIGYKDGKSIESFKDKEKEALNYKVRFFNAINLRTKDINRSPFYFNNIDKKKNDKNKFAFCETIDVEFFSLNKDIIKVIEDYIEKFLLVTNFGFRQNKGYGSFYPLEHKNSLNLLRELYEKRLFCYIEYSRKVEWKSMMDDASIIYQLMKSGINFPDKKHNGQNKSYHRGYLFCYMVRNGIGNEKKFIKENFFQEQQRLVKDGVEKKYVRAMLGVAEGIEFNDVRKGKIKYSSDIERFKSPILFKIVDNILFIIPQCIPVEMYNNKFIFSQVGNYNISKEILTPRQDQFCLNNFIENFAEYFNRELQTQNVKNPLEDRLKKAKLNKIQVVK